MRTITFMTFSCEPKWHSGTVFQTGYRERISVFDTAIAAAGQKDLSELAPPAPIADSRKPPMPLKNHRRL